MVTFFSRKLEKPPVSECVCECICGTLRGFASGDLLYGALGGIKDHYILFYLEDVVQTWVAEILVLSGTPFSAMFLE